MVMVLETTDDFSFEAKAAQRPGKRKDAAMGRADVEVSEAAARRHSPGEKWIQMEKIFEVRKQSMRSSKPLSVRCTRKHSR